MQILSSCTQAIRDCKETHSFAVAHLYNDDVPMKMHIHDTYEIYYSISGGRQFLIDNRFYDFAPGDIFFINQFESHYLSQLDKATHERIVLSIDPAYLISLSSAKTDLNHCFSAHDQICGHKISLTLEEQQRFRYFIHRFRENEGQEGEDILDRATFMELLLFLNISFRNHNRLAEQPEEGTPCPDGKTSPYRNISHHEQVDAILSYINQNIKSELSIEQLAANFYMSSSNICKIFKEETGTTLNRYITAKRITIAKELLSGGSSVTDACMSCGFRDYSNFLKAFTKAVGVSPKKYAALAGIFGA